RDEPACTRRCYPVAPSTMLRTGFDRLRANGYPGFLRVMLPEAIGEEAFQVCLFLTHEAAIGQRAFAHHVHHRAYARGRGDLDRAPSCSSGSRLGPRGCRTECRVPLTC